MHLSTVLTTMPNVYQGSKYSKSLKERPLGMFGDIGYRVLYVKEQRHKSESHFGPLPESKANPPRDTFTHTFFLKKPAHSQALYPYPPHLLHSFPVNQQRGRFTDVRKPAQLCL